MPTARESAHKSTRPTTEDRERTMKTALFLTAHQQKLAFLTLLSFLSLC
jgi:hypothetical protein